jgi:peptidoglycan/xylan/chitin deacetylase (PgdA/CDA1 family)
MPAGGSRPDNRRTADGGGRVPALKDVLKAALASDAAQPVVRLLRRPRTIVLAYHRIGYPGDVLKHVDADEFRRQMQWVKRHCLPIEPADVGSDADPSDRRPRVAVTFDDGYRDYFEIAYPILRELGIPAANFISTHFIDTGDLFWWDVIDLACHMTRERRVTLPWSPGTKLDVPQNRDELRRLCKTAVKSAPDSARERLLTSICTMLGVDPRREDLPRQVMTWDQIRRSMDITRYGGHTHTHVRVSRVDPVVLDAEIRRCHARLAAETGVRPTLFAYPIGDGSEAARRILPAAGFEIAFTMRPAYAERVADPFDVPRFAGSATLEDFAWLAMGRVRRPAAPIVAGEPAEPQEMRAASVAVAREV